MFGKYPFSKEKNLEFRIAGSKNDIDTLIKLYNQVDINSYGSVSEQTAAHRAAAGGHIEALQLLFNLGADFSLADSEGNTPRDLAKTVEAKKLFLLIDEGYAALEARKSFFIKTERDVSTEDINVHRKHWNKMNEKIHQQSEYIVTIMQMYKKEAADKELTTEEIKQFPLFSEKLQTSLMLLHHIVAKLIIFNYAIEFKQKICSCGQAAAVSFAWLAYFKKVDFSVEELNLMEKHDSKLGHAVLILNRDQNTSLTEYKGWRKSLIIDSYFNRIFFFNFVAHYHQNTCLKAVEDFDLLIGASSILPPFPTEILLPGTKNLYEKTVVELSKSILAIVGEHFPSLAETKMPEPIIETFHMKLF